MNCPVHEEDLALYATGDLAPKRYRLISAHVQSCAACRATLAEFSNTAQFVTAAFSARVDDNLRFTAAPALHAQNRRLYAWAKVAAVAAGILLPALLWFDLGQQRTEDRTIRETELIAPAAGFGWRLPNLYSSVGTSHPRHSRAMEAGLRNASITTDSSGSVALRLTTADPNVVILLPMDDTTHAN